MKITITLLAASIAVSASSAPASAWYARRGEEVMRGSLDEGTNGPLVKAAWRRGYAPYYRQSYSYRYDPSAAVALGLLGVFAGAAIASQGGYYPYAPAYGYAPVYSYTPGPCPQWFDGYSWNYSCN